MKEQTLDKLIDNLNRNMQSLLDSKKHLLEIDYNKIKLLSPINLLEKNRNNLKDILNRLNNNMDKSLMNYHHNLDSLINTLKLVNPLNILSNGYSLVRVEDKVIKDSSELKVNDIVDIKFSKGSIKAKVKEIKN